MKQEGDIKMEKQIIDEQRLNQIAGGVAETFFKIEVEYTAVCRSDPNDGIRNFMTFAVEPDETVGHIEERLINFCWADGGEVSTYYKGTLIDKGTTMAMLGIREREKLLMRAELYGYSWGK